MSGYKGGFGSGGVDYGATQEKGRVMEQVRSQIAVANLQEMIMVSCTETTSHVTRNFCSYQKMSDKCFRKCVSSPSTSLDNREQVKASSRSDTLVVNMTVYNPLSLPEVPG